MIRGQPSWSCATGSARLRKSHRSSANAITATSRRTSSSTCRNSSTEISLVFTSMKPDIASYPTTLLAERTYRCPLHCPYCSNPLHMTGVQEEMTTSEWKRVLSEARELGVRQLGLSGGEPLVRPDVEELAAHARSIGLYTTLVTSGVGLTRERARKLREAGLEHVQISLQDSDEETADLVAGMKAVGHKMAAADIVRELGFVFSVNVVLHR